MVLNQNTHWLYRAELPSQKRQPRTNRLLPGWSQLQRKLKTKLGNCVFVVEQIWFVCDFHQENQGLQVCIMIPHGYSL